MKYSVPEAQAQLSKLLDLADRGEEVLVVRRGRHPIRLVAVKGKPWTLGLFSGSVRALPDSAFEPLSDTEAEAFWSPDAKCGRGGPRPSRREAPE